MSNVVYSPFVVDTKSLPSVSYTVGLQKGLYTREQLDREFPPETVSLTELKLHFVGFHKRMEELQEDIDQSQHWPEKREAYSTLCDANDSANWRFKAFVGVNAARDYCTRKYGDDLSLETTEKLIVELVNGGISRTEAEALKLNEAMDLLEKEKSGVTAVNIATPAKPRKKPGRKPTNPILDKQIYDANETGEYAHRSELAKEFNLAQNEVDKAIDRERHKRKKPPE